ncbi:MAG: prefoldin subunit alpha [Candidatus Pacearchaeota archaeon]|jgi:prefoldin alpha subunit
MEQNQQEMMFKLQMFEQQLKQIQQQLQAVEQGIVEMSGLNLGLSELVGKKDSEIFAPIGRGIFAKAKLVSEELTVDVGEGNMVKKTIPETKKIIETQIEKLEEAKMDLTKAMNETNEEFMKLIDEAQSAHVHSHEHNHECKGCGDEDCTCDDDGNCECEK